TRQTTTVAVIGAVILAIAIERGVISTESMILLAVVGPSIILHEISLGGVALWFGDDTAKRAGRLTLTPIPHIDPFVTLILPAVLTLAGAGAFGYAKPVPVNVGRLRHPRNEGLLVSLAGPATNIGLALASVAWLRFVRPPSALFNLGLLGDRAPLADRVIFYLGYVNVILATFNLLP